MLRFLSHMFIVSVLAPAMGGAVYTFWEADWHDAAIAFRFFGSLLGGFVLLAFVWFWSIPLGLVTCALCLALRRFEVTNRGLWGFGGAVLGLMIGWFIAIWAKMPLMVALSSGIPIGAVAGLALRDVWGRTGSGKNEA